jgi:phytoene desaturase
LKSSKPLNSAVIGSGIAGLASAIRLASMGVKVTVYEKSPTYGGKLGLWQRDGYRFDTGPSLFTMPDYVIDLLTIDGLNNVSFDYDELDVLCNYFWEDKTRLSAFSDREKLKQEFKEKLGEKPENIDHFLNDSRQKYQITNHVFLEKSLHKLSTYLRWETLKSFLRISKVGVFKKMHVENVKQFTNPKSIQFFDRYATYNGSNPYESPATLNVIPHYEFGIGAYFPKKGMRSIVDALYEKALKLGVQFKFSTEINQLIKSDNVYKVDNEDVNYELVVCNIDIATASQGPLKSLVKVQNNHYSPSSSALIFYWGIKKEFKELDLHNIFFSANYQREFESIFKRHTIDNDPTIYVQISSKFKKNDAPSECENWFVMVNAPYVEGQDWNNLISETKKNILMKLSRSLGENIQELIEVEHILSPQLIWDKTGSYKGALYGSSSNNRMSAFLRHSNFSRHHKGLYFCGGSVHPGGGIPLCLLSAKITTDIINNDFKIC